MSGDIPTTSIGTIVLHASRTLPDHRRRRWSALLLGATVVLVAGTGCGPGAGGEPQSVDDPSSQGSLGASALTYTYSYTGAPVQLVVPAGVTSAQVVVGGGTGGKASGTAGGVGALLTGILPVKPGQVLTVGVGGWGVRADGNKAPGAGGWGMDGHGGGRGGRSKGSLNHDGPGGGGASVIEVDGSPVVVAAGGGGSGPTALAAANGNQGGNGGGNDDGDPADRPQGGKGATATSSYDPTGKDPRKTSGNVAGLGDGGGGGGGGWHSGEGGGSGDAFTIGYGGGGGNSLHSALTNVSVRPATGDGSVTVTFASS